MRTIWLASYPKSGNTWLRMLIAALSLEPGRSLDINSLPERRAIASSRETFDYLTLLDSDLLTFEEVDLLRPGIYAALAAGDLDDEYDTPPVQEAVTFVKVHDAYSYLSNSVPLLAGAAGAAGGVLIVRDPRDLASSLAHHNGFTIDDAIDQMNDSEAAYSSHLNQLNHQLRHRLLDWSGHAASWLDQSDIPIHLLRYEDLAADTTGALASVLAFAGRSAGADAIARAVESAGFAQLKAQEAARGFREVPRRMRRLQFFRRGEAGAWRSELTDDQVARIERHQSAMMRRLGYEVGSKPADMPSA